MTDVAMFVYGTLQVGEPLHSWIRDAVIDSEDATASGFRLVYHPLLGYPRMVEGFGEVRGQVLWVDADHRDVVRTIDMEVLAGYDLAVVNVETDGMVEPIPAVTFLFTGALSDDWLPVVDNDWRGPWKAATARE